MAYSPPDRVSAATPIGLCAEPRDNVRQARVVALHLGGRRPGRLDVLAVDGALPEPLLAGPTDGDRIAHRGAVAEHEVEPPLARADEDRAGLNRGVEGDHLAGARRARRRCQN